MSILWACSLNRFDTNSPWVDGDRVIATDGHIAVSVPLSQVPTVIALQRRPSFADSLVVLMSSDNGGAERVLLSAKRLLEWAGDPDVPCEEPGCPDSDCSICCGTGKVYAEEQCADCGSWSSVCAACVNGRNVCACDGTKRRRPFAPGVLLGVSVDRRLVARALLAMGVTRGRVTGYVVGDPRCGGISLSWRCAEAVVMPLRCSSADQLREAMEKRFPGES